MIPSSGARQKLCRLKLTLEGTNAFSKDWTVRLEGIQFRMISVPRRRLLSQGETGGIASRTRRLAKVQRPSREIVGFGTKKLLRQGAIRPNSALPNTHVPVVVCRSAGIWTRGQLTAPGRPAAGGEPANPAKRGTRLEATTDRAFLVSAGPPKVGAQRGLSILPGVRTGDFLVQTMALIA